MGVKKDSQYRAAAKRMHHSGGTCEIDDNAKISKGDEPGAYVQAWVWVPDDACDDDTFGKDH